MRRLARCTGWRTPCRRGIRQAGGRLQRLFGVVMLYGSCVVLWRSFEGPAVAPGAGQAGRYPAGRLPSFLKHYLFLISPNKKHPAAQIEEARSRLDLPAVDYEGVMAAKLGIARQVYDIQGGRELEGGEFKVGSWWLADWLRVLVFGLCGCVGVWVCAVAGHMIWRHAAGGAGGSFISWAADGSERSAVCSDACLCADGRLGRWRGCYCRTCFTTNLGWRAPCAAFCWLLLPAALALDVMPLLSQMTRVSATAPQAWFADNESWLVPYAAFCWLRDLFGTAEHWRWGAMAQPSPELLARVTGPGGWQIIDQLVDVGFSSSVLLVLLCVRPRAAGEGGRPGCVAAGSLGSVSCLVLCLVVVCAAVYWCWRHRRSPASAAWLPHTCCPSALPHSPIPCSTQMQH